MESLLDRNIILVPRVSQLERRLVVRDSEPAILLEYLENMVSIYDKDTQPRWVKGWNKEVRQLTCLSVLSSLIPCVLQDNLPNFGPRLASYRRDLFRDPRLNGSTPLEDAVANAICTRLPSIVESCDLARVRAHLAYIRGANEAERRQAWDQFWLKSSLSIHSSETPSIDIVCARLVYRSLSSTLLICFFFLLGVNVELTSRLARGSSNS